MTWTILLPVVARPHRWRAWIGISVATASHGLFDAMSTYGAGIAFFLPFTTRRFSLPWRPLNPGSAEPHVSIGLKVLAVFGQEFLVLWVPSMLLLLLFRYLRRRRSSSSLGPAPDAIADQ